MTIYFGSPDKKEFRQIVRTLAQKNKIEMPEEDLLLEANKWGIVSWRFVGKDGTAVY